MEGKKVIILGSSRKNGNTTRIVDEISKDTGIDVIDLSDYSISYYDYESKNKEDDFLPLIRRILEQYDTLIFATPIYWYNMSGIMKVFFDRFSDLIRIEKETGRKLRGKKIGVISNSHDNEIEESFYIPFKKSADYLGMEYLGHAHFNANILNHTTKIELTFI
ncbi:multimeric flavodoxin WrbA [Flavobacterium sp. 90]|uniref:flavodoxin family protein n=1 Tax=unclassified Flavobacterium TaxID=196869 RepID=UPI000EAD9EAD|nr:MULTISPECIES: flavodoxin family protein [unclassified Flavobacterium]RKR10028.1 multimeric flavodoxin WrbA [Flavobacterium sp. 81]TCK53813.1 multimeric flavodoxin WrbA [Flavobacterium sp. 90]